MTNMKKWEDNNHWVEIDLDLCMALGEYIVVCPAEIYEFIDGKVKPKLLNRITIGFF